MIVTIAVKDAKGLENRSRMRVTADPARTTC